MLGGIIILHMKRPKNRFLLCAILFISSQFFSTVSFSQAKIKEYSEIDPIVDEPISKNRMLALEIYKRLAGIGTAIDNPVLAEMEAQLDLGDKMAAARIATEEPSFYNLVVRDFAARMSNIDESINAPLTDFVASFIGATRDGLDARTLLTGNHYYMGSAETGVPEEIVADLLKSNRHYEGLESGDFDLASTLTKIDNQNLRTPNDNYVSHPDAAGVITSRAFMGAHALDGTNRRLVEYTFKQFTCNDMEDWADATATDIRVGRDIDRFPGGEGAKYLTT